MQVYCEISNISINYDTECYLFILKPDKWDNRIFKLAAFPILGRYDDWGRINIDEKEINSENLKLIESYFNCDLYDLINIVFKYADIEKFLEITNVEELKQLKIMYVRKDVYDYLSEKKFNGEPYTGSIDFVGRNGDIKTAIRLFGIDDTEVCLYEFHVNYLKRGLPPSNSVKDYSFEYFLKEYGLIANYMLLFDKFEKELKELSILSSNMKYLSKTWTPFVNCITHQFQEYKVHKKILKEFDRIMTKSLKDLYK